MQLDATQNYLRNKLLSLNNVSITLIGTAIALPVSFLDFIERLTGGGMIFDLIVFAATVVLVLKFFLRPPASPDDKALLKTFTIAMVVVSAIQLGGRLVRPAEAQMEPALISIFRLIPDQLNRIENQLNLLANGQRDGTLGEMVFTVHSVTKTGDKLAVEVEKGVSDQQLRYEARACRYGAGPTFVSDGVFPKQHASRKFGFAVGDGYNDVLIFITDEENSLTYFQRWNPELGSEASELQRKEGELSCSDFYG